MIKESNRCIECDCDTLVEGFVNRVPYLSESQDAYICGNCMGQWEEEHDLLVADGVLDFESAYDQDSVISILEDRTNNATLAEERIAARHRLEKARAYYTSEEWMNGL